MCRPEIMDSSRYVANLISLYNMPLTWDVFIASLYSDESDKVDIYQPLITFILSRFTKDGNILFAVFGIVYGYFYSRNIWMVLDLCKEAKIDRALWVIIIAFICLVGFWQLNGVRMWTAAHIFFYGIFQYLVLGRKKGIFIAILSVLVHFSYILLIGVFLVFILVKISWRFLYYLFLGSFFISSVNIPAIKANLESVAPAFLLPRVNSYTSDEYVEVIADMNETVVWYIQYHSNSLMYFLVVIFTVIYFSDSKKFKDDKSFSNIFGFSLLILSIGNITSLLPSGVRYLFVAQLFGVALLVYYYIRFDDFLYKKFMQYFMPLVYFYIVVSIRVSFDTISVMSIFANPIFAVAVDMPVPLIDLIK
jgi:hypothetical protein